MIDLVIGDVHGCGSELNELLKIVKPQNGVLVGDVFTKGKNPKKVWKLIQKWKLRSVQGNHDAFLSENWGQKRLPVRLRTFCKKHPEARSWLENLPLFIEEDNLIIVHAGVHPTKGIKGTDRNMALRMRRFPPEDPESPFWYDAGWQGPQTVVFGHDALRGLVRREHNGKIVAIGLDTGCVYGKKLSGWIPHEDRIVSVDSHQAN